MPLLHIYDGSDRMIVQTAEQRGVVNRVPIDNADNFISIMDNLLKAGTAFDRVLFETHGSPGKIYFGKKSINAEFWRKIKGRYNLLLLKHARLYFNGCNVAEDSVGWEFLEAAAGAFMTSGGGEVFGQTSMGFGNPFNGHVIHLWGVTKKLYIDESGRIVERFEQ